MLTKILSTSIKKRALFFGFVSGDLLGINLTVGRLRWPVLAVLLEYPHERKWKVVNIIISCMPEVGKATYDTNISILGDDLVDMMMIVGKDLATNWMTIDHKMIHFIRHWILQVSTKYLKNKILTFYWKQAAIVWWISSLLLMWSHTWLETAMVVGFKQYIVI